MFISNRSMAFRTVALAAVVLCAASCSRPRPPAGRVTVLSAPAAVPQFGLFELVLRDSAAHPNPFVDVSLDAEFTAPGGARTAVPGFYYGDGRWMLRFRPSAAGRWTYRWAFAGNRGSGSLDCTLPTEGRGRIRRNPANPHRWIFETGEPYFPLGMQEGSTLDGFGDFLIDGEGRSGPRRTVSMEEYFRIYSQAGFNLFRFSQRNQTYSLFDDLDHYRERESLGTDRLLAIARRNGFRVMFGFFGYYGQWDEAPNRWRRGLNRLLRLEYLRPSEAINRPDDSAAIDRERRFVRYCVARWGVYADFWELLNERRAAAGWLDSMARYVHSIDPDRKPVSTSWERPDVPAIDLNAPHWYESENELASDLRVSEQAARWKAFGKPVLVGEQGNTGMNWDPGSSRRMRIRSWTALFQEIGLIFWNLSWSKFGINQGRYTPQNASNIYLGPEERGYTHALAGFAARLDAEMKVAPVSVSGGAVRAYGLLSPISAAAYLHHYGTHSSPVEGARITLAVPNSPSLSAQWIEPATGKSIASFRVEPRQATLAVPPFHVDLALLIHISK